MVWTLLNDPPQHMRTTHCNIIFPRLASQSIVRLLEILCESQFQRIQKITEKIAHHRRRIVTQPGSPQRFEGPHHPRFPDRHRHHIKLNHSNPKATNKYILPNKASSTTIKNAPQALARPEEGPSFSDNCHH